MKTEVSEKVISLIWQHQLVTNLATDMGKQLQIIYPGRVSHDCGCDFRDAVFAIDGKTAEGDIELHVKSSQWYSHGHHQDPKYNNIALHVVMWHDSQSPTLLQNGNSIPTIYLSSFLSSSLSELNKQANLARCPPPLCPEATKHANREHLNKLINAAGEERFAAKIISFQKALIREEAGQVLFLGIARALGYAKNTKPFEELTNRLLLSFFEKAKPRTSLVKQSWILGTAGLLPSQRPKLQHKLIKEREVEKLEIIWQASGITEAIKEADWHFFRVRPDNFPTRRLIALSHLLDRYHKSGLLQGMVRLVKETPPKAGRRWLENGLTIASQGYWANHFDFGLIIKRSSALLGREKAAEITINTILPFICAWGEIAAEPKLKKKAAEIYHCYPKLGDNELTRYMKQQLLLEPNVDLSACQQQGLIHVFKTYCRQRNCAECPITLNQD